VKLASFIAFCAAMMLAAASSASGEIWISRIYFDSPGPDTGSNASLNDEWIRIKNGGPEARSLRGWRLTDRAHNVYRFGAYKLAAHKTVTVHTGSGRDRRFNRFWASNRYIWGNERDQATLWNRSGTLVSRCTYSAGQRLCEEAM
jgi:hypothetical protein